MIQHVKYQIIVDHLLVNNQISNIQAVAYFFINNINSLIMMNFNIIIYSYSSYPFSKKYFDILTNYCKVFQNSSKIQQLNF